MSELLIVDKLTKTFGLKSAENSGGGLFSRFFRNSKNKTDKEIPPAIYEISLILAPGEKIALIGPDGAGKTTFLRLLAGLLVPDGFCAGKNQSRRDNESGGRQNPQNGVQSVPNCAVNLPDNSHNAPLIRQGRHTGNLNIKQSAAYGVQNPSNTPQGVPAALSPVLIDGVSPYSNLAAVKKLIGYMPQQFGLYEDLSVIENLEFYAGLKNIPKNERAELFETLLKFAGLIDFKERPAGALSGGMKQKLGLSCTLLSKPKLLLLDEPSVGVDPLSRRDLINITDKLATENKIGIIWATSYLDEAKFFGKALLLSDGKKIYYGSPDSAKSAMEGLVYYTLAGGGNRIFLDEITRKSKGVIDASIEGGKIRVVFESKRAAKEFQFEKKLTAPIFEDFVMSALGGQRALKGAGIEEIKECPPDNVAIEANNLTKVYGNFTAASNINFKVKKGEIFGLLGPNGAGKSTTFKMLCALIKPTFGNSKIMGHDIIREPISAKKSFGYMAQKFSLFGNLSVRKNIEFFAGVYGVKNFDIIEAARNYELEKYLDYNASTLPLGFKQHLALLCAVIHKPPVLFLDEPTSGVDPVSRREFWARINALVRGKTTLLVTTHFMDEAQFCDRIALVYRGKILVEDTPENLKNSVRSKNLPEPDMEDTFIELIKRAQ